MARETVVRGTENQTPVEPKEEKKNRKRNQKSADPKTHLTDATPDTEKKAEEKAPPKGPALPVFPPHITVRRDEKSPNIIHLSQMSKRVKDGQIIDVEIPWKVVAVKEEDGVKTVTRSYDVYISGVDVYKARKVSAKGYIGSMTVSFDSLIYIRVGVVLSKKDETKVYVVADGAKQKAAGIEIAPNLVEFLDKLANILFPREVV